VRIDAVNAGAGCLTVEGAAADDGALVALEVGVDGHVNALPAAVGPYAIEICGLVAGCYAPVVRAVDDGGLAVEVEGPLTALGAPGFVEAVEGNLTDHLPRMGNYPGGYGVADETYLALFNRHGIDQPFTLYRTAEGAWYYDPAHLPGAPAPDCDGEPDPDPDPDPEPPPAPMIKIQLDPPVVDGDCVLLGGLARFTPAARTLAISVNNRLYEPVLDANSHFAIRACGLAPGCYPASLIFITAAGIKDKAAWPNFGVAGPAAAAVADGTINQHLSRYAAYPAGYGVADATYVEIFHAFGLNKSFRLYQSGADGRWYINPARLPAAEAPRCR
ncbi:MAG: hypothetical protein KC620_23745, partial [Myxococcales bacterium]|nr:hypothetical protein [Myxococcales bacterium]